MLPESVRERVVKEQNELRDKITKLALFVYSAKIETVDEKQVPNTKDVTVKMSVKCGNKQA